MRYTRLRRAIEGGTLIGTHGTPFQGGQEKVAEGDRKRKKPWLSDEVKANIPPLNDDDFEVTRTRSGSRIGRAIKTEEEYTECYGSDEDTEEDIPLVKRRASARLKKDENPAEQVTVYQHASPPCAALRGEDEPVFSASQGPPSNETEALATGLQHSAKSENAHGGTTDEQPFYQNSLSHTQAPHKDSVAKILPAQMQPVLIIDSDDSEAKDECAAHRTSEGKAESGDLRDCLIVKAQRIPVS